MPGTSHDVQVVNNGAAAQIEEEQDPHEDEDLAGDVRKEGGRAMQAAQERAGTVY